MPQASLDLIGKLSPFRAVPDIVIHEMEPVSGVPVIGIGPTPDQPITMQLVSHPGHQWVPVFSRKEDLYAAMKMIGIQDFKIKVVEGPEFAESIIDAGLRIMLDPRLEDGKTKWTEVVLTRKQ